LQQTARESGSNHRGKKKGEPKKGIGASSGTAWQGVYDNAGKAPKEGWWLQGRRETPAATIANPCIPLSPVLHSPFSYN